MLFLARHGQTDANAPPARVMGKQDLPLNHRGREQARELAEAASGTGIEALWSSSLRRARETAEIVGSALGLEPRLDPRFEESDRGEWEGRLIREIQSEEPELWRAWRRARPDFRFPGGESLAEHMERVAAGLSDVKEGPLPALVICHGGTIRCAFASLDHRRLDAFHELDVPNAKLLPLE
jgi:broad specificity phosphatase PhoE